jgi:AcrR family transcriptional regulator
MPRIVDHDLRRAGLAQAAAQVIATQGMSAASLRDVAAAGGVTTGAVTHYFPGRSDLIAAAYDKVMGRLLERLEEPGGHADLLATLASYLPQDPETEAEWRVWLAFSAEALVNPALSERHRAYYAAITARLAADLSPVQADLLVALIDGLSIRILLEPHDWPAARITATLSAALPMLA